MQDETFRPVGAVISDLMGKIKEPALDLDAIKARRKACLVRVNGEGSAGGRMAAWGMKGAGIIRNDVPALIAEIERLRKL